MVTEASSSTGANTKAAVDGASGTPTQASAPGTAPRPATTQPSSPPTMAAITPPRAFSPEGAQPPGTSTPDTNHPGTLNPMTSGPSSSATHGAPAARKETPGEIALHKTTDPAIVGNPLNWAVMVYKSRHELVVYFEGHLYKKYRAVFGRSLELGTKEWAGDRRTPEGVYEIIRKRPNRRWRYFLQLNYPNNWDRRMYRALLAEHEVPRLRGRAIPEGGAIGIHGTDEPMLNAGNVNWTTGCISVGNGAIDELDTILPVGTLVIIKP